MKTTSIYLVCAMLALFAVAACNSTSPPNTHMDPGDTETDQDTGGSEIDEADADLPEKDADEDRDEESNPEKDRDELDDDPAEEDVPESDEVQSCRQKCLKVPENVDYGSVVTELDREVTIENYGEESVYINEIQVLRRAGDSPDFEIVSPVSFSGQELLPLGELTVTIRYTFRACEEARAVFQVISTADNGNRGVFQTELFTRFSGNSTFRIVVPTSIDNSVLDFAQVGAPAPAPAEKVFQIFTDRDSSQANRPLEIETIRFDTVLHPFTISGCNTPFCILPGQARECTVSFQPLQEAEYETSLEIIGTDHYPEDEAPLSLQLALVGEGARPGLVTEPSEIQLGYIRVEDGYFKENNVVVRNSGSTNVNILEVRFIALEDPPSESDRSFFFDDSENLVGSTLIPDTSKTIKLIYNPVEGVLPRVDEGRFEIRYSCPLTGTDSIVMRITAIANDECPLGMRLGEDYFTCIPDCEVGDTICCVGSDPQLSYYCECLADNQLGSPTPCGIGLLCEAGECVEGCIANSLRCNPEDPLELQRCNPEDTLTWLHVATCTSQDSCREPACLERACTTVPLSDIDCDDDNACTTGDACVEGVCIGQSVSCDDENECTEDLCDETPYDEDPYACRHEPANEGDSCGSDPCQPMKCTGGECLAYGEPFDCDDDNDCTEDVCDASLPDADELGCVHTFLPNAPCDDGNFCTVEETCNPVSLRCMDGVPRDCEDGDPCTRNECNESEDKCDSFPQSGDCDDGNPCTLVDRCGNGSCVGEGLRDCDDDNVCTEDGCDMFHPLADPETGCVNNAEPFNGMECHLDDDNVCTPYESCVDGQCSYGEELDCEDDNQCTEDMCQPHLGCRHIPITGFCDDGNICTEGDYCQDSYCRFGDQKSCDDGDPCTIDYCNSDVDCSEFPEGECDPCIHDQNEGGVCDDGNVCTQMGYCGYVEGVLSCQAGRAVICLDDGNPCTDEICLPAGDPRNPLGGCTSVANDANTYDDGNPCTNGDHCDGGEGVPGTLPPDCDDGNPCTEDLCNFIAHGGCYHNPVTQGTPCDDGLICTTDPDCTGGECDICVPDEGGKCVGVEELNCNDGNPCTLDRCSELVEGGCLHEMYACDPLTPGFPYLEGCETCSDAEDCLEDLGTSPSGMGWACIDEHGRTADEGGSEPRVCVPSCSDQNGCTTTDYCTSGACHPGYNADCDDGNPCTKDFCDGGDPGNPCYYESMEGEPCVDDDPCTVASECNNVGQCVGTVEKNCDDGNICTDEVCDPETGMCTYEIVEGRFCSDGSECTQNDTCNEHGNCTGDGMTVDDGDPCTYDYCNSEDPYDPIKHVFFPCYYKSANPSQVCQCEADEDCALQMPAHCSGEQCYCHEGICAKGCVQDDFDCTHDLCNPWTLSCIHPIHEDKCLIGTICHEEDELRSDNECQICLPELAQTAWTSRHGTYESCTDDGNICTKDYCRSGLCYHPPKPYSSTDTGANTACNDNNACTLTDWCYNGYCKGFDPKTCNDGNECTDNRCNTSTGNCYYPAVTNGTSCYSDGNSCTYNKCQSGECRHPNKSAGTNCTSDSNVCTYDECDGSGTCTHNTSQTRDCANQDCGTSRNGCSSCGGCPDDKRCVDFYCVQ